MAETILACVFLGVIGVALYAAPKKENAIARFFGALIFSVALMLTVSLFATFTTAMLVALIALFIGTVTLLGAKSWLVKVIFIVILVILAITIGSLLDFYPEDTFPNNIITLLFDGVRDMIDTIKLHAFE